MTFIGLDPATCTGYAYRPPGQDWRVGTVTARPTDLAALRGVLAQAKAGCVTCAVIEDCYLGRDKETGKVFVQTLKLLAAIQGGIMATCGALGIEFVIVEPSKWKAAMLPVNGHVPRTRDAQKKQAVWVAEHALGVTLCEHKERRKDEADAACICEWAALTLGRGE